jgi:lipoyl-dependent peroxiredoxin
MSQRDDANIGNTRRLAKEINMRRIANATWKGGLKDGAGTFSVQSGVIKEQKFGFRTRFEDAPGTNPEELIAAAHASCFSMALSAQLGERGITPEVIETTCTITFENLTLASSLLKTTITAPGADRSKAEAAAAAAKVGCPISKVLKLEIALELTITV